jgi:hypothetical protein
MSELTALTKLEQNMLKRIARSCYSESNGHPQQAKDTATFIWDVIEDAEDKGVVTSLNKKQLVTVTKFKDPDDNSIELTESGFRLFLLCIAKEKDS